MRQGAHGHPTAVQKKVPGRKERRTSAGHVLYEWPPVRLSSCRDSSQTTWHCRGTLGFNKPMHHRSQERDRERGRGEKHGSQTSAQARAGDFFFCYICRKSTTQRQSINQDALTNKRNIFSICGCSRPVQWPFLAHMKRLDRRTLYLSACTHGRKAQPKFHNANMLG